MGGETRLMRACAIFGSAWDDGLVGKMSSARSVHVILGVVMAIAWTSTRRRAVGAVLLGAWVKVASVNVGNLRTGCGSRSAPTATNSSLAPPSMPAASGCRTGTDHTFYDPASPYGPPAGRVPRARMQSKLPIEIAA